MPPVVIGWWADALAFDFIPPLAIPLLTICAVSALPITQRKNMARQFFYHAYAAELTITGVLAKLFGKL